MKSKVKSGKHTRKSHSVEKTDKERGIFTIPELRVGFERIEDMVADLIKKKESDSEISKKLVEEWRKIFYRTLDKDSAKSYIEYVREEVRMGRRARKMSSSKTRKQAGGGAQDGTSPFMNLQGADINTVTRPGLYPPAGDIPPNAYGKTWAYVDNNFNVSVPEQGYKYDQTPAAASRLYPTAPDQSGTLGLAGGARSTGRNRNRNRNRNRKTLKISRKRKQAGGATSLFPDALYGAPFPRIFTETVPESLPTTAMRTFNGQPPHNVSPDPSQNSLKYLMGPNMGHMDATVAKIPVNLKNDITVN